MIDIKAVRKTVVFDPEGSLADLLWLHSLLLSMGERVFRPERAEATLREYPRVIWSMSGWCGYCGADKDYTIVKVSDLKKRLSANEN